MKETYVKLKEASQLASDMAVVEKIDVYCPIDLENKRVTSGLTLVGFVPEGAEIVGEFEESTGIFIPNWAKGQSVNQKQKQMETK